MSSYFLKKIMNAVSKAVDFVNGRSAREKKLFLALAVSTALFLDYWALFVPTLRLAQSVMPRLSHAQTQIAELRNDIQREDLIEKKWQAAQKKVKS